MDQKYIKARWAISLLLASLVALHLGAAAYYWLYGGVTLELGFTELRIHQWHKPWFTAMGLWLVITLVRPRSFIPINLARRLFDPWSGPGSAPSAVRPWTVFGAAVGSALGFHLAWAYHYLTPHLGLALPMILAATALGAALHGGYAWVLDRSSARWAWDKSEAYRSGQRTGFYVLIWLGLAAGPLREWEGRYYDPPWPLALGAVAGLAAAWALALSGRARRWVALSAAALAVVAMAISAAGYYRSLSAPGPRDRVIFITLDTTRPDHLSCYGYERPTSPRIDAVAAKGVRFERAVCPMGSTNPSHVSMFTGYYPRTHGAVRNDLPAAAGVPSLADHFSSRGFSTAAIASRALLDPARDLAVPGFDYASVPGRTGVEATAPAAFRRAANWLSGHRTENVFIWVHFFDPHLDYRPHPDLDRRFSDADKACRADDRLGPRQRYTRAEVDQCVDLYDEEIAYMDLWVGKLLDWIDALEPKSERPPLVVLVGDHGEALGEYQDRPVPIGFGHPAFLYEGIIRIPLIISWPGVIPQGQTRGGVAETVDLAPTLAELVFGKDDFPAQGQSLAGFILEGSGNDGLGFVQKFVSAKANPSHADLARPQHSVYGPRFKLVLTPDGPLQLFDVDADPLETQNLADRPPEASVLHGEWVKWMERTPETAPQDVELDRSHLKSLRALGYVQD